MSEEEKRKIIDGLRYCSDGKSVCGESCPAYRKKASGCRDKLMKDAAAELIKALQRDATQVTGYCPICAERAKEKPKGEATT